MVIYFIRAIVGDEKGLVMCEVVPCHLDIEEYVRGDEPGMVRRADAWQTVIGLQAVDGLTASGFLLDTAREHVEGTITIDEAQRRIQSRYERRGVGDASDGEPTPHTLRHGMGSDGGWLVARMSHG